MKTIFAAVLVLLSTHAMADDDALIAETKKKALEIPPKLLTMVQDEISNGSLDSAIAACRDKAPKMAAAASQATGWEIRRVSLKNRNPKAMPDDWERAALQDFDRRAAMGESPATIEKSAITTQDGRRTLHYMKALPTQQVCLSCHGKSEQLTQEVKAKLNELYPADQAIGYSEG